MGRAGSADGAMCAQVQLTAVDELYVEQDAEGGVLKQIARVRIFFLGFLSGQCIVNVYHTASYLNKHE